MNFKDIINNLKLSFYRCSVETSDPFLRADIERKLTEMGIHYLKGYTDFLGLYSYAIIGVDSASSIKKKREKVDDFLDWFQGDGKLKCFSTKNELTRIDMYSFYRADENIDLSRYVAK